MLGALGRFTVRRRRWVLTGTLLAVVAAGGLGGGVFGRLSGGGFSDPDAASSRGAAQLERVFDAGDPNLVLLVTARGGSVDDPSVAAEGVALTRELASEPAVRQASSYWTLGPAPPLRSHDGRQALVLARIAGNEDQVDQAVRELLPRYTRATDLVTVAVGGQAAVFRQISAQVENDLRTAEAITFPIVLLLLVLVFGSVVAAGLPLAVALISVAGTLLVLLLLTLVTDVSVFSINLTTALGVGLGIDYSLFIVSRFREELHAGLTPADAVVRTVETAGRTVLFSGLTVAISLAALLVFPLYFLRSFAYAGIAVVALACLGALVALPSLLAVLGGRVDRWTLLRRTPTTVGVGAWRRIATFVMRRPWPIVVSVVAVLLLLGTPFLGVQAGLYDDRVLPKHASSRQVQDQIRANFSSQEASALQVVAVAAGPAGPQRDRAVDRYAAALSSLDAVARVDASTGSYQDGHNVAPPPSAGRFSSQDGTWLAVVPSVEPISSAGERLVHDVRSTPAPFQTLVSGPSAELVDSRDSIFASLPLAVGIIAVVTFVLLFVLTGGVLVPLKAIVLNLLSLSATFGAMVWTFQQGNLSGLLDFTATGTLNTSMLILMFCIAFGLSMDYEVFLLSRIKEEHDRSGNNQAAVALGLERTGRIVTAAAALLGVVFLALVASGITFLKMFGVGMALAVIVDATLIRAALVPAFMRLAGNANWWAPGPLRRLHDRIGLRETAEPVALATPPVRLAEPPSKDAA